VLVVAAVFAEPPAAVLRLVSREGGGDAHQSEHAGRGGDAGELQHLAAGARRGEPAREVVEAVLVAHGRSAAQRCASRWRLRRGQQRKHWSIETPQLSVLQQKLQPAGQSEVWPHAALQGSQSPRRGAHVCV
jgi:hypothetical protein